MTQRNLRYKFALAVAAAAVLLVSLSTPSSADVTGGTGSDGSVIKADLDQKALAAQAAQYRPPGGPPTAEFTTSSACGGGPDTPGDGANCPKAITACANGNLGPGPLEMVYRRPIDATGAATGPWQFIGRTCYPDAVPGAQPQLTLAMIINAFHLTPWAKSQITTQPVGNRTLVGLDTYYQVNWSAQGYQPGEVNTVNLLGYQVDIRPRLDHFTYVFGDGQTFGPTTDTGGVYPTGTITHQYLTAGTYASRVDTTFGADFRVNGGEWTPIPDTVTVPGPGTPIEVHTAENRLVQN